MTFPGDAWWQRVRAARLWQHPGLVVGGVLVAVLAGLALWAWATLPWGVGANSDGLTYLVLARQWARTGTYTWPTPAGPTPMTHFPPAYPQVLVLLMALTGTEPAHAAWLWSGLGLTMLVLLAAREVFAATRHLVPTGAVALWLAVAFPVQRVYTLALSETLFLVQILWLAWALDRWHTQPHSRRAVLVGLLVAWAVFTRWIGVVLLAWAAWDTLYAWFRRVPPGGRRQGALALAAAGLPVAALLVAGAWVAPAATGRVLRWHPPTATKWLQAAETFTGWVTFPFQRLTPGETVLVAGLGLLTLTGLVVLAWRMAPAARGFLARWTGFVMLYIFGLTAAITVADASTPMDWRLLAPVFVALSLLAAGAGWMVLGRHWPTALLLAWVGLYLIRVTWAHDRFYLVRKMHNLGAGLRNSDWQTADVWPVLRALPPEVVVVTNELPQVVYYADRPAWPLLPRVLWRNGQAFTYDVVAGAWVPVEGAPTEPIPWAALVAERWRGRCALLAFLTVPPVSEEARTALAELEHTWTVVQRLDSGVLLRPPQAPACYDAP